MARIPRTPPKPPFWDAEPGICRGCGQELLTKASERARNRRWCADCSFGWRIAGHPTRARAAVFLRDVGICHDCGEDCTSYETLGYGDVPRSEGGEATYRVQINRERSLEWCERVLNKKENPRNPQSEYAIDLGNWHMDHAMPLHLIDRDKPDAWREWTLPNLRTRCPRCHGDKTAQEAKDRGKVRRLNGTTQKKPSRKIPQRANPWPKSRRHDDLPPVEVDKPQLVEAERWGQRQRDQKLLEDAAARELDQEMARIQATRNRIQAAHQDPPKRKPKPNKLGGKGFGR